VAAVPITETIVHAGDAAVQSMVKSAAVKRSGVKPTAVESTGVKPATMEPSAVKPTTMEPATAMEASTTVAATAAMRSVGEVWRAERDNAQHGSCSASQGPSDSGPGALFAQLLH
jgi:hypothetical protein